MATNAFASNASRWQRFMAGSVRAFHFYAGWLVSISWWRFILLSILLLIVSAILQNIPPFSWRTPDIVTIDQPIPTVPPRPPAPPELPRPPKPQGTTRAPTIKIEKGAPGDKNERSYEISIDEHGVRITPKSAPAASAAEGAASQAPPSAPSVEIKLPPGATSDAVREAVEEARRAIVEAIEEEARDQAEAARDAAEAARDAAGAATQVIPGRRVRTHTARFGDPLPELAFLWIVASLIIKITYKQQIKAEAQAAQATETAEAESLKRQVVEARMAAMQAQVEPHFLFNTLASIDHLIETDPSRASTMQKNLIALLRASMPTMREAGDGGPRDLKREIEVIRPYLEILKVRMEDRLRTEIDVPDGLLSAEFPSMMIQTLVENAVKHGLEPKPEGGSLSVRAEVQHGKLAVTVADTGVGFGKAATSGTGVGLANVRERLQLLYGNKASLSVRENSGGGTAVTITVPYKSIEEGLA
jgi:signal transduction histidine kinase